MKSGMGSTGVMRVLAASVLLAAAGGAAAQRLSLEGLQQQLNAKIALSDLAGCAANDVVVRMGGMWKCKSALPRFVDNGNGTLTDNKTGLMWEKKSPAGTGDVHDVNKGYSWSAAPPYTDPTGSLYTSFLQALNNNSTADAASTCFANYCDWRIPTIAELQSILSVPWPNCTARPCIDAAFGPTQTNNMYWASTTQLNNSNVAFAWGVDFFRGQAAINPRQFPGYARAVRGSGS